MLAVEAESVGYLLRPPIRHPSLDVVGRLAQIGIQRDRQTDFDVRDEYARYFARAVLMTLFSI